jgi:hypothetical protein
VLYLRESRLRYLIPALFFAFCTARPQSRRVFSFNLINCVAMYFFSTERLGVPLKFCICQLTRDRFNSDLICIIFYSSRSRGGGVIPELKGPGLHHSPLPPETRSCAIWLSLIQGCRALEIVYFITRLPKGHGATLSEKHIAGGTDRAVIVPCRYLGVIA